MTKNNVLITGAQGYIGSYLLTYLSERGVNCKGIDTGYFKHAQTSDVSDICVIDKDVRNINESDLKGIDCLVHLAAISNDPLNSMSADSVYDPVRVYTKNIAHLCKKNWC